MQDAGMPRVFISYSRTDSLDFARRVESLLEAEGLLVYRDLSHLEGGEDWWRQVEAAIRCVEHVVLVLSPAALRSPYVVQEWKLARQEGKRVSPIDGSHALDLSHSPGWMARAHRHDIDVPESLARLIQVLKGPAGEKRVPFMADPLPQGFVPRPEPFERLKRSLLDARGEPVAITAALRGAGGYGKTALANALCHDADIQDAFSDGILRVTLGERPEDLVGRIADLIQTLIGQRPDFHTSDAAKVALADALDDRRCLLVIDDAWRSQDLVPFLYRGPRDQTTRLVTTRDDGILPEDATRVAVDSMRSDEAQEMLAGAIPTVAATILGPRLTTMAGQFGHWPLLVGLARGVIRARIAGGASAADALEYVEHAIEHRGIGHAFRPHDRESRRQTAWGTLEVSLEQLEADERVRFEELAVFAEDAEIPITVAIGLWHQTSGYDPVDGEDLLARLSELSLLSHLDLGRRVARLHDVVRTLLREGPVGGRLVELERCLIDHFRNAAGGDLARLSDGYGLRYLIAHLKGAGEVDVARGLLTSPVWLSNKLEHVGVQPLLADYRNSPDSDSAVRLIGAALTLAAPALARNPKELAAQVLSRLEPEDAIGIPEFLAHARSVLPRHALVPGRPTFTSPGAELRRFDGAELGVASVKMLTDGRRALAGSGDGLRVWDLDTGAELRHFASGFISEAAVLADGRHALSGSFFDQTLSLWDLETGTELRRFEGHQGGVNCVAAVPSTQQAVSGSADHTLRLWDLETGTELRRFEGHEGAVICLTVLVDGQHVLSGSGDLTLRLWDLKTGAELRRFEGPEYAITSVAMLTDGRRALGASGDKLWIWDLETGVELRRFHADAVACVAMLPDGRRALSGSYDRTLRLWDLETGAELRRFHGHEDFVTTLTVLPDGRRALSGSDDRTVRLWDLDTDVRLRRSEGHEQGVTSVKVLADGRRVVSGALDGTLRLWDLETGAALGRFKGHDDGITTVMMLPDGRRALSAADDRTLRLWDLEAGSEIRVFVGHEGAVTCVTVLADGRHALSGSRDETLRLWDLENGAELRCLKGHRSDVSCATVLPEARRALSGSGDGTLRLWDLKSGGELRCFDGHEWDVTCIAALDGGRRALSGSRDATLRLWDLETGSELRCFEGHEEYLSVTSVIVLSDGRRALSGSDDRTLRLWDLQTAAELRRFEGHDGEITSVTVMGDGRRVLSMAKDRTVRLWDLETGSELARLTFDVTPNAIDLCPTGEFVVGDGGGRVHVVHVGE
jgi:WD40 repeat protein